MENVTAVLNVSELIESISTIPGFSTLIKILQTAGIIFIVYLIFLFFKGILQYKKFSRIKKIDQKLDEINKTLTSIEKKLSSPAKRK